MSVSSSILNEQVDIEFYKGNDLIRDFAFTDENGALDFSSSTFAMSIVSSPQDLSAIKTLTIGSGISVAENVVTITLTNSETDELDLRTYYYSLKHTSSGGIVTTYLIGKLIPVLDYPND